MRKVTLPKKERGTERVRERWWWSSNTPPQNNKYLFSWCALRPPHFLFQPLFFPLYIWYFSPSFTYLFFFIYTDIWTFPLGILLLFPPCLPPSLYSILPFFSFPLLLFPSSSLPLLPCSSVFFASSHSSLTWTPFKLLLLTHSLLSHSSTFLSSSSFIVHQEVHTSDESDCDDDLDLKTGMEVRTHTVDFLNRLLTWLCKMLHRVHVSTVQKQIVLSSKMSKTTGKWQNKRISGSYMDRKHEVQYY